jgi:UDP-N-acetylmuramoyl-tripeptide--D-alanyl-D-alanine ligase
MGARHVGDISSLIKIANPIIGTVLVVGTAHVGEFGSREKIAQAKGE